MTVWIVSHRAYLSHDLDSVWETEELAKARVDYLWNEAAVRLRYTFKEEKVREGPATGPSTSPTLGTALLEACGHKILPDGTIESDWKKEVNKNNARNT